MVIAIRFCFEIFPPITWSSSMGIYAVGSGNFLTRKVNLPISCTLPSVCAATVMTASPPTFVGRAMYLPSPFCVKLPPVMLTCNRLDGIPGTLTLMGLSYPAYRTFMISALTVALGGITVYFCEKSRRTFSPLPFRVSIHPVKVKSPVLLHIVS